MKKIEIYSFFDSIIQSTIYDSDGMIFNDIALSIIGRALDDEDEKLYAEDI